MSPRGHDRKSGGGSPPDEPACVRIEADDCSRILALKIAPASFVRDLIEYGLLAAFVAAVALAAIIGDPFGLLGGVVSALSKVAYVVSQ